MDIRPVEGIRVSGAAGVRRIASDPVPEPAIESSVRMEDDSYGEGAKGQERGMEEEDAPEAVEEGNKSPESPIEEDHSKQVNLFA